MDYDDFEEPSFYDIHKDLIMDFIIENNLLDMDMDEDYEFDEEDFIIAYNENEEEIHEYIRFNNFEKRPMMDKLGLTESDFR